MTDLMRVLAYELLTQAIVVLGRLREAVVPLHEQYAVRERVFDLFGVEQSVCCDCGLAHHVEHFLPGEHCGHDDEAVGHMWPERPKGYRYRLRFGAAASDLARERGA